MTVTVPATVDPGELERELVTAVADRLRDDHGYRLAAQGPTGASAARTEYLMDPAGKVVVDKGPGALNVKLRGLQVDAHDLFTGISSELELRHEGLRTEIG
jgi:hypothetical protein